MEYHSVKSLMHLRSKTIKPPKSPDERRAQYLTYFAGTYTALFGFVLCSHLLHSQSPQYAPTPDILQLIAGLAASLFSFTLSRTKSSYFGALLFFALHLLLFITTLRTNRPRMVEHLDVDSLVHSWSVLGWAFTILLAHTVMAMFTLPSSVFHTSGFVSVVTAIGGTYLYWPWSLISIASFPLATLAFTTILCAWYVYQQECSDAELRSASDGRSMQQLSTPKSINNKANNSINNSINDNSSSSSNNSNSSDNTSNHNNHNNNSTNSSSNNNSISNSNDNSNNSSNSNTNSASAQHFATSTPQLDDTSPTPTQIKGKERAAHNEKEQAEPADPSIAAALPFGQLLNALPVSVFLLDETAGVACANVAGEMVLTKYTLDKAEIAQGTPVTSRDGKDDDDDGEDDAQRTDEAGRGHNLRHKGTASPIGPWRGRSNSWAFFLTNPQRRPMRGHMHSSAPKIRFYHGNGDPVKPVLPAISDDNLAIRLIGAKDKRDKRRQEISVNTFYQEPEQRPQQIQFLKLVAKAYRNTVARHLVNTAAGRESGRPFYFPLAGKEERVYAGAFLVLHSHAPPEPDAQQFEESFYNDDEWPAIRDQLLEERKQRTAEAKAKEKAEKEERERRERAEREDTERRDIRHPKITKKTPLSTELSPKAAVLTNASSLGPKYKPKSLNQPVYAYLVDITDKFRKMEYKDASDIAERETQIKGRFLASVSHELRTPLHGIIGMMDQLMETSLDREQMKYAKLMAASAESLLQLVNDLLDLSKLEVTILRPTHTLILSLLHPLRLSLFILLTGWKTAS
eukprot:TRINITY_DN3444_c0_g1_i4.p1 TRINITY_DN3444_c0_g1~~TRINITY_DN3444_c0_g1_i4.p1  ORF type:complete len:798 (+),score=135.89 TRINITY_DN3444_c0_g1_i4:247-2640(+)